MRQKSKKPSLKAPTNQRKNIKYRSDYQIEWEKHILQLRKFDLKQVNFLSITGDAPKDFITDSEYRPGYRRRRDRTESYIAKVGSKWYPIESVTEHLITRIGQLYGLKIADSKLRIVHGQVRFMSRYFLNRTSEQLTHGAEMFELILGKENYAELAELKREREFFSFQMVEEAIKHSFPEHVEQIMRGFVEMLTFDALIGHNDRHPYNWGVIVPLFKNRPPRFSPVYDTARALFWNKPERSIRQMLDDQLQFFTYVNKCAPPIGWDGQFKIDFFRLIGLISGHFEKYSQSVEKFLPDSPLQQVGEMIDKEFRYLLSTDRRELLKRCLQLRQHLLKEAVAEFGRKGE